MDEAFNPVQAGLNRPQAVVFDADVIADATEKLRGDE
jgi:hypothetical protein